MRRTLLKVKEYSCSETEKWDIPLGDDLRDSWVKFLKGLFELEDLQFTRCLKPELAEGELITFSDASEAAYGACAYVRWMLPDSSFSSRLVMAKAKVAPKKKQTVPRLELCGAVLGSRLRKRVVKDMGFTFSRIVCLTDSMIVCDQIQKENSDFKMFSAPRVGEIQENCTPSEWSWIGTSMNPADMTTKFTEVSKLASSFWKEGPEFLKTPFEDWPIKTECYVNTNNLPDTVLVNTMNATEGEVDVVNIVNLNVIDINRFSLYTRLINVTSIILSIARISSFKVGGVLVDAECYSIAEKVWIQFVQGDLGSDWRKKFKRLGPWMNESGLIVVGERLTEWFKMPWNQQELVLLPYRHKFTFLYCLMIHNEDHTLETSISKVRRRFWVPQLTDDEKNEA